jgi:hypothetical protein
MAMAKDRVAQTPPIRLSFRSETKVVVEPDDHDRFVVTMREAALACKRVESDKEWEEHFSQFLVSLEKWAEQHLDRINAVLVNVGDGALNIFVCTISPLYDTELDDTISDLDIALVKQFPWLVADIMQFPGTAQGERVPYEKAILVYGDGRRPQATSTP